MIAAVRDGVATAATAVAYRDGVLPAVRRELEGWLQMAAGIPDAALREDALAALTEKASNPEATALLATLAPRATRRAVIRASTALQVAIDYLDNLGERAGADPLGDGLQLHRSLGVAVSPGAAPADWYLHHPHRHDGGYLDALVTACQEAYGALPSQGAIQPVARRAAERCGAGQSHTHAAPGRDGALEAWARTLAAAAGFEWWEIAAGASSSVPTHALIALAGRTGATGSEAEAVDGAYFPSIGALTVLLDDLVDSDADRAAGEHNYLEYYPDSRVAAERLAAIAAIARGGIERLPQAQRHGAILAGVVAYYLSDPRAGSRLSPSARSRLLRSAGPTVGLLTAFLRLRHPV